MDDDDYPAHILAEARKIEIERLRGGIQTAIGAISEGYEGSATIVLRMMLDPTYEVDGS